MKTRHKNLIYNLFQEGFQVMAENNLVGHSFLHGHLQGEKGHWLTMWDGTAYQLIPCSLLVHEKSQIFKFSQVYMLMSISIQMMWKKIWASISYMPRNNVLSCFKQRFSYPVLSSKILDKVFCFNFNWRIVDLQCYVSFRLTAKSISYTYINIPFFFRFFSLIGHYRVLSRVPCAIQ